VHASGRSAPPAPPGASATRRSWGPRFSGRTAPFTPSAPTATGGSGTVRAGQRSAAPRQGAAAKRRPTARPCPATPARSSIAVALSGRSAPTTPSCATGVQLVRGRRFSGRAARSTRSEPTATGGAGPAPGGATSGPCSPDVSAQNEKARCDIVTTGSSGNTPGSDLLSHTPTHAVPSAVAGLTSVFGMGTGVTLPL